MKKNEEIEKFIKLSNEQKGNLTLSWLSELVQAQHLTIQEVMDILNSVETTFSKIDKFNSLLLTNKINASTISRLFGFGYAKSMKIINLLVEEHALVKTESGYVILDKEKFKEIGKRLFEKEN